MKHYVAKGTGAFETTRADIEALRYLNDPRKAARYLGLPQAQIEDVWAEMPGTRQRDPEKHPANESSGINSFAEFRAGAEEGSAKLKDELLRSMLRWGKCNGTTPEETVGFLLYGRPYAAKGHIPFEGHRTQAEVG